MAGNLGYFTLPVRDVDAGVRFYGRLFGWTFAREGDAYAHAENASPAGGINRSDDTRIDAWFRIDDIEASIAVVRELGGTAAEPSESASGWSSACTDDQGTKFNLWQPAAGL